MDEVVREIIALQGRLSVPIDQVAGADDLYAVGVMSHTAVNVMLAIEDRFAIEFPDALMSKSTFATVDALAAAVRDFVG